MIYLNREMLSNSASGNFKMLDEKLAIAVMIVAVVEVPSNQVSKPIICPSVIAEDSVWRGGRAKITDRDLTNQLRRALIILTNDRNLSGYTGLICNQWSRQVIIRFVGKMK